MQQQNWACTLDKTHMEHRAKKALVIRRKMLGLDRSASSKNNGGQTDS